MCRRCAAERDEQLQVAQRTLQQEQQVRQQLKLVRACVVILAYARTHLPTHRMRVTQHVDTLSAELRRTRERCYEVGSVHCRRRMLTIEGRRRWHKSGPSN